MASPIPLLPCPVNSAAGITLANPLPVLFRTPGPVSSTASRGLPLFFDADGYAAARPGLFEGVIDRGGLPTGRRQQRRVGRGMDAGFTSIPISLLDAMRDRRIGRTNLRRPIVSSATD